MSKYIYVSILLLMHVGIVQAQEYVEVTGSTANVRISPSESAQIVGKAYKGMIFSLEGTPENWYEVALPSGEYRYFHTSLGTPVESVAELTNPISVLKSACAEYIAAERRANKQAKAQEPDIMKQIDLSRVLVDKYKLEIHKKYDIPPARKVELTVWCVTN